MRLQSPIAVLAVLAVAGCGGQDDDDAVDRAAAEAAPVAGGVATVVLSEPVDTLDPHQATQASTIRALEHLHAGLLRYGDGLSDLEGDLAASWSVDDDGLAYRFTLREGLRFHGGAALDSAAVRWSLERIRARGVRKDDLAAVSAIETPDMRTVVLRLREPMASLLTKLAHPLNAVLDPAVVEAAGGEIGAEDAGCGPFRLERWRRGQELTLARFDGWYAEGRPLLDGLRFVPIADATTRNTALRTGEAHLLVNVTPRDRMILERSDEIVVRSQPGTFFEYVGINTRRAPFDDARVRQAVAWAVDRAAIAQVVRQGQATVLDGGHVPPGHWAHLDEALYPRRDVARARALLAEAGRAEGFSTTLKVSGDFEPQRDAAELVKQQLADVGIAVEILAQEPTVFYDALARQDFDLTVVGWIGFVDPDEWCYDLFHSGMKWNQQGYANEAVDRLLEEGRRSTDRAERARIYRDAQRLIATDAPMAFLHVNEQITAHRAELRGYREHATGSTRALREAWLAR